ncbi:hypothetical protein OG266_22735 [Streptomyces sp. NBC_00554]|uniref:hypothetical protein n=1 Tax=Streptomyces sp. NBC_00554 TaxID=2903661 RepID=UPI00352E5494|nr:hypothetical protein OG266_22735 [Streptomyces sp. NBC_00554]
MSDGDDFRTFSFSEAARHTVDEVVEEFRSNVQNAAVSAAYSQGAEEGGTVTARHVSEAARQIMADMADPGGSASESRYFTNFLWALTGTYVVIGLAIVFVANEGKAVTGKDSLILAGGSLIGTIFTMVLKTLERPLMRYLRRAGKPQTQTVIRPASATLMMEWLQIENVIRSRMGEEFGASRVNDNLADLIQDFSHAANLSGSDSDVLSRVLGMRNQLAHDPEAEESIDPTALTQAIRDAKRLVEKFSSINLSNE